jgi:hypothetical protein
MSQKQGVIIFYHYPEDICLSDTFYKEMQHNDGFKNILVQIGTNTLRCSDYNKAHPNCVEVDAKKESNMSCIVGFDKDTTTNLNNKLFENIPTNEMDMIVDSAIILAD